MCGVASAWKVIESAPALTNSSALTLGALDHQVRLEHRAGVVHRLRERRDDQRADGDRRHEMPVHDVDVDHARPRGKHLDRPARAAARSRPTGSTARRERRAAARVPVRSYGLEHRVPAVVALEDRGRGHPHDRRVLAAVGAHRGELEAVQAVHAAIAAGEVGGPQPRLAAVGALRPEIDRGLRRRPSRTSPSMLSSCAVRAM